MKRICAAFLLLGILGAVFGQDPLTVVLQDKKVEKKAPVNRGRGYIPPTPAKKRQLHAWAKDQHDHRIARLMKFQELPPAFDCADKGWMSPVGDQGSCGSCYLYSSVQNMTDAFIRAGFGKPDGSFLLAPQYGMDCHNFGGCGGGNGNEVVDWACRNGWYAEKWVALDGTVHIEYPGYEASSRSCRVPSGARLWKPTTWGYVTSDQSDRPPTVDEVKTALYNYGTLNIALDAGGQFGNGTGTITSLGNSIDHEIRCTAYDDAHDNGDGTKGAVLFVNQWGTSWGNNGKRWASYKVVPKLVAVFWVSAGPLPPPVPPIPPGPGPLPPPVPGAPPVIASPLTAAGVVGAAFNYQIVATNAPSIFLAVGLPAGLSCSTEGLISGTPTVASTSAVLILAANNAGAGTATLALTVTTTPVSPVMITLTSDQVQTVLDQAGGIIVNEGMTLKQLLEILQKNKKDPPCLPALPMQKPVETKEPPVKEEPAEEAKEEKSDDPFRDANRLPKGKAKKKAVRR